MACFLFQVLEGLIAEDDSVPDVWYLLGLSLHAGGDFQDALTAANEAERLTVLRKHDISNAGEFLLDLEELKVRYLFCRKGSVVLHSCPCLQLLSIRIK